MKMVRGNHKTRALRYCWHGSRTLSAEQRQEGMVFERPGVAIAFGRGGKGGKKEMEFAAVKTRSYSLLIQVEAV